MHGHNFNHPGIRALTNTPPPILIQAKWIEQPAQTQPFYRPMTSNLDSVSANFLQENIASLVHFGHAISPASLAAISSNIVTPASFVAGSIDLPGGFFSRRFSVHLTFLTQDGNTDILEHLIGFTEHAEYSFSGQFCPTGKMYLNNYMQFVKIPRGNGGYSYRVVANHRLQTSMLMAEVFDTDPTQNDFHSMDTRRIMCRSAVAHAHGESSSMFNPAEVLDTRQMSTNRMETMPSRYLQNTLANYQCGLNTLQTRASFEPVFGSGGGLASAALANHTKVATQTQRPVLRYINTNMNVDTTGYLDIGQFMAHYPDIDNGVYQIHRLGSGAITDYANVCDHNGDNTEESRLVAIVNQSIPAMLSSNILGYISVSFNNFTTDGSWAISIHDARFLIDSLEGAPYIQNFVNQIQTELGPMLTGGRHVDISVAVTANIEGNCTIQLSFAGGEQVTRSFGSFMDSADSVLIATNDSQVADFSNDINKAINEVFGDIAMFTDTPYL